MKPRAAYPSSVELRRVPRLLNGDHLSVPEFERRYEAMPPDFRAELIEGIVVMAPPISPEHGSGHGLIFYLVKHYAVRTPGLGASIGASVRLDGRNEFQPDCFIRIEDAARGRSRLGPDRLFEGAPELVAEIAVSSAAYDLHEKKSVYERCGVQEYIVWQVMDAKIHWFTMENGAYTELTPRPDGVVCSRIFPGLWLDVPAIVAGDEARAVAVVDKGVKSAAHKTFAASLKT